VCFLWQLALGQPAATSLRAPQAPIRWLNSGSSLIFFKFPLAEVSICGGELFYNKSLKIKHLKYDKRRKQRVNTRT
jgi:hypothetical protein